VGIATTLSGSPGVNEAAFYAHVITSANGLVTANINQYLITSLKLSPFGYVENTTEGIVQQIPSPWKHITMWIPMSVGSAQTPTNTGYVLMMGGILKYKPWRDKPWSIAFSAQPTSSNVAPSKPRYYIAFGRDF
jgi:hypothetical protein